MTADGGDDDLDKTTLRRGSGPPRLVDTLRSDPPLVRAEAPRSRDEDLPRYEARQVLGEGGMGEILLSRDRRIGRYVAMKVLRPEHGKRSDGVARFEREARVQGQLEHPGVVPVYDLGVDEEGRSFFTMKRVRGRTLAEVLEDLRDGDEDAESRFSQRRLLAAFAQLCQAVAFAHSRGVLHRDIKPGNVMLGDFGEVHLLDWGIATVIEKLRAEADDGPRSKVDAMLSARHRTLAGEMIGTPGYMSPEQIRADPDEIDERADVFALGALLFEMLTLEPLVPGEKTADVITATLGGVDARTSARAPGRPIAPELEAICVKATAPLAERYASVMELEEEIQRYLDGDRDIVRRRELAMDRIKRAEAALASEDGRSDEARAAALHDLAEAVALDPENEEAQRLLGRVLVFGPDELPLAAREALQARRRARMPEIRRLVAAASLAYPIVTAPAALLGVRDAELFGYMLAASLLPCVSALISWRLRDDRWSAAVTMGMSMLAAAASTLAFGPLVLVPTTALAVAVTYISFGWDRARLAVVPLGAAAFLGPLALQLAGVLPESYRFDAAGMTLVPAAIELPRTATLVYVAIVNVATLAIVAWLVLRQRLGYGALEERLFLHAWNLRNLLPEGAGVPLPTASVPPPPPPPSEGGS